ncbi:peptidoglycan-recognition protein LA isoform X2 [Diabrotica virgifera virgifera]|uniref:Peptidoglycan-recognition protein LA-like isoform X2 n=1 Tax=Diabrotica virgifera virgifera TaxID=50390 RepID=A0A6P7FTQ7_DIAVI|nr:peptidoglycan-recognition protein LA isoform X2 [Diabrotica virgifera virgifera]
MSHRFSYPSLMGPNLDAKPSELPNPPNSDVALSEYDDGYNNGGLDVCSNEFAEVANRELINRELVNLENAVVNIDNSNDVIIGPVTQFNVNGNVTIFHNKDGQPVEIEEKSEISPPKYTETTFKQRRKICPTFQITCWKERKIKRDFILKISFFLITLSSCLIVYLLGISTINKNKFPPVDTCYGHTLGNYSVYYRDDYDGVPPTNRVFQPLPLGLVVVGHTNTKTCDGLKNCSKIVRTLQDYDINSQGYYDLAENFLIGVDGSIYVARGWDVRNGYPIVSIAVSFIGNFNVDLITDDMVTSLTLLLRQGVKLSKLAPDYIIVGENQTAVSVSPGTNVFGVLKEFCHYSDIDLKSKVAWDLFSAVLITVFNKTSFSSSQHQKLCIE